MGPLKYCYNHVNCLTGKEGQNREEGQGVSAETRRHHSQQFLERRAPPLRLGVFMTPEDLALTTHTLPHLANNCPSPASPRPRWAPVSCL